MAGWIKMPLGKDVDLRPGDIVLDGDPAPKGTQPPNFRPMFIVAKLLGGSTLGTEVDLSPGDIVQLCYMGPSSPPSYVYCGQTKTVASAELVLYCMACKLTLLPAEFNISVHCVCR